MAVDFEGGLPIKTVRDNDAAFKIVDGASGAEATNKLSIPKQGDAVNAGTNDFGVPALYKDSAGNYKLLTFAAGDRIPSSIQDSSGNELALVTDGQVVSGTDRGVLFMGTDGTNYQLVKTDTSGQLLVVIQPPAGLAAFSEYDVATEVAKNASADFEHVIANGKTGSLKGVLVGCRAAVKIVILVSDGDTTPVETTHAVLFQQIQDNEVIDVSRLVPAQLGDGSYKFVVRVTNLDGGATDIHVSMGGEEI
jgi:hypothetical protein